MLKVHWDSGRLSRHQREGTNYELYDDDIDDPIRTNNRDRVDFADVVMSNSDRDGI